jgi:hypothetical protein
VSEIKVPEKNVLNILVSNDGKIFMSMDKTTDVQTTLEDVAGQFGLSLSPAEEKKFLNDPMWGVPMNDLKGYLSLPKTEMPVAIKKYGIPTDSVPGKTGDAAMSEFQIWVKAAKNTNPDAKIAIKADEKTPYRIVKKIMSELQDMNENRYYLITQYKKQED